MVSITTISPFGQMVISKSTKRKKKELQPFLVYKAVNKLYLSKAKWVMSTHLDFMTNCYICKFELHKYGLKRDGWAMDQACHLVGWAEAITPPPQSSPKAGYWHIIQWSLENGKYQPFEAGCLGDQIKKVFWTKRFIE